MAADEALADVIASGQPILRVFRWRPYTISIGYNQNIEDIDAEKCKSNGIGIVRRPTGGGAILHANEVTYSVILPRNRSRYSNHALDLYNQISSAIIRGLNQNGLPVVLEKKDQPAVKINYQHCFACFATSATYEIHYESRKLVGSAQRRFKNAVLQHGSIILGDEHLRILDYWSPGAKGDRDHSRKQLHENTVSMQAILKRRVTYQEVAESVKRGFESYFDITFRDAPLSDEELKLIDELRLKYLN